jgi:hypothetical protein
MQQNSILEVIPVRNTVLFVDGLPVGYKIFRNGAVYFLHPTDISGKEANAPLIIATHSQHGWEIEDLRDRNLIDQVVEDLDLLITEPLLA